MWNLSCLVMICDILALVQLMIFWNLIVPNAPYRLSEATNMLFIIPTYRLALVNDGKMDWILASWLTLFKLNSSWWIEWPPIVLMAPDWWNCGWKGEQRSCSLLSEMWQLPYGKGNGEGGVQGYLRTKVWNEKVHMATVALGQLTFLT